ncbi:probable E3 ubiquitin-protein ligase makorin-2 [Echinops telfairi]|uniref:Probable E3 ubiquitin-protein ligase makorin-2 n=1 Tax=Echinops telfairi TaxID=9371 RepID=A0AC55D981_ECHTE|nr:probable E3 ubiquitin-protein ligase makorin-2 [Echinops telfairi]
MDIIKSCPQCRVRSSFIIPNKTWVGKGPKKAQLIQRFKARTSQIRCRFFWQGNGHCPFKSDCIYQHQAPLQKALISGPTWPESVLLPSGSEVLSPAVFLRHPEPEDNVVFTDWPCPWSLGPPLFSPSPGAPPGCQQF